MIERIAVLLLLLLVPVACGDDTGSGGGDGAGGDDLVVTVAGAGGGGQGCTPNSAEDGKLACQCRDGSAGDKTCVANEIGETYYTNCETPSGDPC